MLEKLVNQLIEERKKNELTTKGLGIIAGIYSKRVEEIESLTSEPRLIEVIKYCEALDLELVIQKKKGDN